MNNLNRKPSKFSMYDDIRSFGFDALLKQPLFLGALTLLVYSICIRFFPAIEVSDLGIVIVGMYLLGGIPLVAFWILFRARKEFYKNFNELRRIALSLAIAGMFFTLVAYWVVLRLSSGLWYLLSIIFIFSLVVSVVLTRNSKNKSFFKRYLLFVYIFLPSIILLLLNFSANIVFGQYFILDILIFIFMVGIILGEYEILFGSLIETESDSVRQNKGEFKIMVLGSVFFLMIASGFPVFVITFMGLGNYSADLSFMSPACDVLFSAGVTKHSGTKNETHQNKETCTINNAVVLSEVGKNIYFLSDPRAVSNSKENKATRYYRVPLSISKEFLVLNAKHKYHAHDTFSHKLNDIW